MPFCGPKLSVCCTILSFWGIIQLTILGAFFYVKSVALYEDAGIEEIPVDLKNPEEWDHEVDKAFEMRAYNCWIAALMYIGSFAFSLFQLYLNKRANQV